MSLLERYARNGHARLPRLLSKFASACATRRTSDTRSDAARLAERLGSPACSRSRAGGLSFEARFEEDAAPETVAAFRRMLPLESKIIHVRWSGEGGWIPMGDLDVGIGPENATRYPSPGELIFYPGGVSETELLLAYGYVAFASKAGALAGNHFATIVDGNENLRELGRRMLWEGAQDITFRERVSGAAAQPRASASRISSGARFYEAPAGSRRSPSRGSVSRRASRRAVVAGAAEDSCVRTLAGAA